MKQIFFLCVSVAAFASNDCHGAVQCSVADATAAESVTDYLDSWDNIYLFFKTFGHCYDGGIAEGVNDKIQLLWANHWQDLHRMLELTAQDPKFKEFVWQRVSDQGFPSDVFASILHNAKTSCPKNGVAFCQAFMKAAASRVP